MKHHILVKFKPGITAEDKKVMLPEIRALFEGTLAIPGVGSVDLYPNCIDRENRYDLMIVIGMTREALPVYDDSEPHRQWKSRYGGMIDKKAIFDCE